MHNIERSCSYCSVKPVQIPAVNSKGSALHLPYEVRKYNYM